jgi:signal transduction histidine kinase
MSAYGRPGGVSPRRRRSWRVDVIVLPLAWILELAVWHGDGQLRGGGSAPVWAVPACTAVLFATLLVRRSFPVAVIAGQLAWASTTAVIMPMYSAFAGVLVALQALAAGRRPTASVLALLGCALPFGLQAHNIDPAPSQWLAAWLVSMLASGAAWGLGYRTWSADRRSAAMVAEHDSSTALALQGERLRIARELHDIVAHSVSIMVLQAAGARAVLATDPHRAEQAMQVIQDAGTQSMKELRRLLGLLRPAAGEEHTAELEHQPSLEDLDDLLDQARTAGIPVTCERHGVASQLEPSVSLTVYRLVQEALTNTMKHAGTGASAQVRLRWSEDQLAVTVEDHTRATPVRTASARHLSTGHGLLGLHERVGTVDGTLQTHPTPTGFVVHALLPASPQPAQAPSADLGTPNRPALT